MFVVTLTYTAPLERIDAAMRDHVEFLEQCYAAGLFLAAGRQIPRVGGVILATAPSRDDLEEILSHDPFIRDGLATCEIVEFRSSIYHPDLKRFADPGTRRARKVPD